MNMGRTVIPTLCFHSHGTIPQDQFSRAGSDSFPITSHLWQGKSLILPSRKHLELLWKALTCWQQSRSMPQVTPAHFQRMEFSFSSLMIPQLRQELPENIPVSDKPRCFCSPEGFATQGRPWVLSTASKSQGQLGLGPLLGRQFHPHLKAAGAVQIPLSAQKPPVGSTPAPNAVSSECQLHMDVLWVLQQRPQAWHFCLQRCRFWCSLSGVPGKICSRGSSADGQLPAGEGKVVQVRAGTWGSLRQGERLRGSPDCCSCVWCETLALCFPQSKPQLGHEGLARFSISGITSLLRESSSFNFQLPRGMD